LSPIKRCIKQPAITSHQDPHRISQLFTSICRSCNRIRTTSLKFSLPFHSDTTFSVCKQFFLQTLDIRPRLVEYTLSNVVNGFAKSDGRCNVHAYKTPASVVENVQTFIRSLPAVPSHYCRSSTSRLYLPSSKQNLRRVYLNYKLQTEKPSADSTETNIPVASRNVLEHIFKNEYNIGFHCQKKDKCSKCEQFKNIPAEIHSDEMKQDYKHHQTEKDATYAEHKHDQELHSENSDVLCASFDLQKVLNTPNGDRVLLFYSRKYAVYNFSL